MSKVLTQGIRIRQTRWFVSTHSLPNSRETGSNGRPPRKISDQIPPLSLSLCPTCPGHLSWRLPLFPDEFSRRLGKSARVRGGEGYVWRAFSSFKSTKNRVRRLPGWREWRRQSRAPILYQSAHRERTWRRDGCFDSYDGWLSSAMTISLSPFLLPWLICTLRPQSWNPIELTLGDMAEAGHLCLDNNFLKKICFIYGTLSLTDGYNLLTLSLCDSAQTLVCLVFCCRTFYARASLARYLKKKKIFWEQFLQYYWKRN